MTNKINQYEIRLFNKLFSTLPTVKKLNTIENDLNLDKAISQIYYYTNKDFWFSKGEKDNKYVFIFGPRNKPIHATTSKDKTLIIDFDKTEQFNETSMGLFSIKNSEIHILINYNILKKEYPHIDISDFKKTTLKSIDNNLNLNIIDLGSLNNDFIENIGKLVKESSKTKPQKEKITAEPNMETNKKENENCAICENKISNIAVNSKLKSLKNKKPEFCGKCIEKIVTAEFYDMVSPLIKSNDTKDLNNVRERLSNDQLFDLGMELLEKYDIIRYIGVKKLFFTIEKNPYLIRKYRRFSDKNNLLIDNLDQNKNAIMKSHEKESKAKKVDKSHNNFINEKTTNLRKETLNKMNLFINALNAGKSHDESCRIAKLDEDKVENWYKFGKKGDPNYVPFYEHYRPFRPENIKNLEKMDKFLEALKKDSLENALKTSKISINKVRAWYNLGKQGDEEYKNFYFACNLLLPEGFPKEDSGKIINNDELMSEFIALIETGKTNDEAIEQLKIPKFKVKNWVKQGELGNKRYVDFYNAYMIEIGEKKLKKSKKTKKQKRTTTSKLNDNKTCKICGRNLSKKRKKDICKRCEKKQYASKIVLKLLKATNPEVAFRKEDLKVLNLHKFQIKDYIWTLKEFNLITQHNNKYKLKNKEFLKEFIDKSGIKIDELPSTETEDSLHKTCKKCGETLLKSNFFKSEISDDGYEDYCKDCKKLITTANYLNEIIQYVDFESEFSDDELNHYFKDLFKLQAKLWSLQENDLIKKDLGKNTYTLSDEKTVNEFLDKYLEENVDTIKEDIKKAPAKTKKEQMKTILDALKQGKTRLEASKLANIPPYKINHWYSEGQQGFGKDNVDFYKQLKTIEKHLELRKKLSTVLKELESGKTISQITIVSKNELNTWIEYGKQNKKPYNEFYEEFENILNKNRQNDIQNYYDKEINRKIFLENLKSGKTKEISAKNADIEISLIYDWYLKGFENEKPFNEFYKKCIEIKKITQNQEIPQIENTNQVGHNQTVNKMNLILKLLVKGNDELEATKKAEISFDKYKYWINRGKQKFGEVYIQFYQYVKEIKSGKYSIPTTDSQEEYEGILNPLPEELEKELNKFSKGSSTGFAWVNKPGNMWIYGRKVGNQQIRITDENIYNLYKKVVNQGHSWGVRNLTKAKESLKSNPKPIKHEIDSGIYAPLPKEYEKSSIFNSMNQSGIAWVNKTGTKWTYAKTINGKSIKISDEDIYELYRKVKDANEIWGIRDYKRARKVLYIPDDFIIPETTEEEIPNIINTEIYSPLPQKYLETFPKQSNQTGIAWVNKIGNQFIYSRKVNGKTVKITNYDIYKLHEEVTAQNQIWGIRNYDNARKFIDIPDDFEIPEMYKKQKEEVPTNTDIYAPLSKEYISKFNPNMNNKSGIAWVNKVGNKWFYQRQRNGKTIRIGDSDIRKLHQKVLKNKQIWGIIDIEKARISIENNGEVSPNKTTTHITSKNVTITYIEKQDKTDIIIKGIIKNNELISLLNKLKVFEENIKRIITTSITSGVDLFIEIETKTDLLETFEEKIEDLNWKINK